MKCIECGSELTSRRENRRYECGLDNMVLIGVEVRHCDNCGGEEIVIPCIQQLHAVIAWELVKKPARLTPHEIRFLRTYLGLSSADLARNIGVTVETVSRWERVDAPKDMGVPTERFLRLMVMHERPVESYPLKALESVAVKERSPLGLNLSSKPKCGWKAEVRPCPD